MVFLDLGNCYIKRIKIIYCKTCSFQSYKMFIQAYFQNDCSCTVLHISDSPAYELLTNIVENRNRLKDVRQLSPKYQTSNLEAFHSVLNNFAPKMFHFHFESMYTRWARVTRESIILYQQIILRLNPDRVRIQASSCICSYFSNQDIVGEFLSPARPVLSKQ